MSILHIKLFAGCSRAFKKRNVIKGIRFFSSVRILQSKIILNLIFATELFKPHFSAIFTAKLQWLHNYCTFCKIAKILISTVIFHSFNKLIIADENNSIFRATFMVILANEGHSSKLKNNKIV